MAGSPDDELSQLERSSDGLLVLFQTDLPSLGALVADRRMASARRLVARCELGVDGARTLAASPHLRGLCDLDLAGCRIGDAGLEALAASPVLATVERLRLGPLIPGGGEPHFGFRSLAALVTNDVGDAGLAALSRSPFLASLSTLDLGANRATDAGVGALAASGGLPSLSSLHLLWTRGCSAQAAELLGAASYAPGLEELDLSWCRVGDEGARALARHTELRRLRRLILHGNDIGPDGAAAFARSQTLRSLEELDLRGNRLGEEGVGRLASRPGLPSLRRLGLDDNELWTGRTETSYDQGLPVWEAPDQMPSTDIQRRWFRSSDVSVF